MELVVVDMHAVLKKVQDHDYEDKLTVKCLLFGCLEIMLC